MGSHIRHSIGKTLKQLTGKNNIYYKLEIPTKKQQILNKQPTLSWTINDVAINKEQIANNVASFNSEKGIITNISVQPSEIKGTARIEFQLDQQAYVETLLNVTSAADRPKQTEHMLFEFSSPNIAKPFHVGHLRSTIIGNVLANLHKKLGYPITKLNYLGDWGTQFGMLQVGVEMLDVTDSQMQEAPIATLYKAYVVANKAAQTDPTVAEKARRLFTSLETNSNDEIAKQWQKYRNYTITELAYIYARLGVQFEQYDWESHYSQQHISTVLTQLNDKQLLLDEHDGRKVVSVDGRRVPIIKSDGSTLYLARDIAALLDRLQRFKFHNIYYVVDNAQTDHFKACFKTTAALRPELSLERMQHIKFGRIHGMSTRNGQVVFLKDILDEAREIMYEKQSKSSTTKVDLTRAAGDNKNTADVLGVSAVIINDLKQKRQRDYQFDWQKVLQVNGDTGIKLQYTHCRLHSLLENMNHIDISQTLAEWQYLTDAEALDLLHELARYEQCLWDAKEQLEACILVNYLFSLCNTTSRALKRLNVKNESCLLKQKNRLLLFQAAKNILHEGMCILGLKPLKQM